MGVVYKGHDPDLGGAVAIKIIRRELVDGPGGEQMRQRFKNEAIAGRRLRHPNIVPVYDYGEDEDCAYIVMAFVEGRSLNEVLKAGPRPSVSEALAITGRLLAVLQHAHQNSVVHRDIKPANILVGAGGKIEVADFGIAKVGLAGLTRTGQVFGTPAYMSPEQCRGTPPSDHRVDIFAAGALLYELLTGERPFRGESELAIMHQVVSLDPEPPSRLNPEVSPALDAVVAKAMAKDREQRFQSAREFAQALKEADSSRPTLDIRAMPTVTDPDPTPAMTRPKTPVDPPPTAVPESPPKMTADRTSFTTATSFRRARRKSRSHRIGKYTILEDIGQRRVGPLYEAYDHFDDRHVVLKVISSDSQVATHEQNRFIRAAAVWRRLDHPNVVRVHDLVVQTDVVFIVLELLKGRDLRHVIESRRGYTLAEKLKIMRQVCEGLHHIHEHGIIHRDIRPNNIFVSPTLSVKVLDSHLSREADLGKDQLTIACPI